MENSNSSQLFESLDISINKNISQEEYIEKIKLLLQPILQKEFPNNPAKQKIRVYKDRISFACPVCGDSAKSNYKKRGSIILEGKYKNFFKCHNCGHFSSLQNFFKSYGYECDLDIINYITNTTELTNNKNKEESLSLFFDLDLINKYALTRENIKKFFNFVEIDGTYGQTYLYDRLQFEKQNFLYDNENNRVIILNLTNTNRIIGFQYRVLQPKTQDEVKNKYKTYKLSKIYERIGLNKTIPQDVDNLSCIFGIFKININKPVVVCEGPFDSFLIQKRLNAIATAGLNKSINLDLNLMFWNDDDKAGKEKSIKDINNGLYVFLWDRFKKEYNLPNRQKWDITDVFKYFKQNNINAPEFNKYFSNDSLDIIDI